jgi:hypothetical protein
LSQTIAICCYHIIVLARKSLSTVSFTPSGEDNSIFSITVEKDLPYPPSSALNDFVNSQLNSLRNELEIYDGGRITQPTSDPINGTSAYTTLYTYVTEFFRFRGYQTYFVHDGNGYTIDFRINNEQNSELYRNITQRMIESIRLLEPVPHTDNFPNPPGLPPGWWCRGQIGCNF